ncbi:tripartite tricarboxylate transporter substrate binding protein [Achromobacter sp. UMC71]|uniref:Bug family tripartite tricarboxylate transporter substrate binding protein n=1 Tax=Achromobacter sp. UMC71 TaxID=1862320 RepID=UPI0016047D56|nr:tripartite tricarboxylate transporter substrate binding protein [Achromobacter sp. UMC71]MBB1628326.1 ABC transporter substrate-binding protein [Achromobacter sp. UMC71]
MQFRAVFALAITMAISIASHLMPASAQAAPFPDHPIQVVIPFQPGDTDNMLRPFLEKMREFLGQPMVLNYRPGAGGGIGAGAVATSAPDGYTVVGSSPGSIVVVPLGNKEFRYTADSFAPIAALAEGGLMLVVHSSAKWKTLKELVDESKTTPDIITFASSGTLGITHLLGEAFGQEAGVRWTHVPFQGSGPAITALLGGHVNVASTAIGPAQAHLKAGTLRALAVFGDTRLKAYPDVPTLKESGYKLGSPTLYGILAPKGTPQAVVDTIYDAARKAVEKYGPQISENLSLFGAEIRLLAPEDYRQYLDGQNRVFTDAVNTLK